MSTITVRRTKEIPENNFSQQRRKEKSVLPLDVSHVIWHGKSWGLCLSISV